MVDAVRGSDGPVLPLKRAGLIDNPKGICYGTDRRDRRGRPVEIFDEGGGGPECVTPGLPSHDCILLTKLGVSGIDCDIAVGGVHKVKPCSGGL